MRIGLISDTHGAMHPRVAEVFAGVDAIVQIRLALPALLERRAGGHELAVVEQRLRIGAAELRQQNQRNHRSIPIASSSALDQR